MILFSLYKHRVTLLISLYPSETKFSMHAILERERTRQRRKDRRDITNYSAVRHQDSTMIKPVYKKTKNKLDWCNAEYVY